eukprot:g48476.t1
MKDEFLILEIALDFIGTLANHGQRSLPGNNLEKYGSSALGRYHIALVQSRKSLMVYNMLGSKCSEVVINRFLVFISAKPDENSQLNEVTDTNKKVEHDIKVAIFTLINEINKKGKNLLQQLEHLLPIPNCPEGSYESTTLLLVWSHMEARAVVLSLLLNQEARFMSHLLHSACWVVLAITFQLRHILRARCDPVPAANGGMRFHCDPTFWAKNVVNLGNLVIENKPNPPGYTPNVVIGHASPGQGPAGGKPQGQINLAQLRLQHMQQQFAQKQQQMQQMRMSHPVGQHPRTTGPQMVQQQPPRLISMQAMPRGNLNGAALQAHQAHQAHQMRLAQNAARMAGMSRHNGHQYPMMPQIPRQ